MNSGRQSARRKRVLYVEDHPVNAILMGALIASRTDLELVVATSGKEATAAAVGLNPVLILLDLRLPDCFGSDLLPLLREIPGCDQAPAVAVTAEPDFRIGGTGFSELWPKPLDMPTVLQRLTALTASQPTSAPN